MQRRGRHSYSRWLLAAALGCATVEEQNPEAPELTALDLLGNDSFQSQDIEKGLATQPTSWVPFSGVNRFDEAVFQGDIDRIVTFYRARGYFDARVVRTDVVPTGTKKVKVTVAIDEGQPSTVRTFTLDGVEQLGPEAAAALAKPYPLQPKAVFTQAAFEATKAEILRRLREAAHAEATLEAEAQVDRPAQAVDVRFTVTPGPSYRFGQPEVVGTERVPAERLATEVARLAPPGAPYQESEVDAAQKRLFGLGVFSSVRVEPGVPDIDAGVLPVVATVSEGRFYSVRAGAGIGVDVEHDEVHVTAGFTDRDFLGGLRRLDFDNTVALEWLPSVFEAIESAVPAFKSKLQLTQPEAFGPNTDLVPSLEAARVADLGFGYWAFRGRLGARWQITPKVTLTGGYNADLLVFDSNSAFNGLDLSPQALLSLSCQVCVLSYVEETIAWDLRDDPTEPTKGLYAQLSLQQAGGPLFGDFSNTRWLPEVRGYLPLGVVGVLAARVSAGALFTYHGSTSPIDQRFFLGGINGVRGYGAERLSPMVRVNTCGANIPGHPLCTPPYSGLGIVDVPVGGNGMFEANLELRHRFTDALAAVAFVDTGEVTSNPLSFDFGAGTLAVTPGVGLRVVTPVGPFRLDLAYQATTPVRPVTDAASTFGQQPNGTFYPLPSTSGGAVDTCPYPFVPQTGWGGYQHPSACKSDFLNRFAFNFAIGEAF